MDTTKVENIRWKAGSTGRSDEKVSARCGVEAPFPSQRAATNRKKLQGDKKGKQFVRNTETVGEIAKRYRAKS